MSSIPAQTFFPESSRTLFNLKPRADGAAWPAAAVFSVILVLLLGSAKVVSPQVTPSEQAPPWAELDAAKRLSQQADKLNNEGKYSEAIPLAERALAIREKALGTEHLLVAQSLNDLAVLYRSQGDYVRAEPLYQRALGIREKALGAEHPHVAD